MKDQHIDKFYTQAAVLGVVAGMRAMSAPAIAVRMVARAAAQGNADDVPEFLQSETTSVALSLLAIAEFIGDKLPNTPNRTGTPGLIGRCVSGALSGAAVCKVHKQNAVIGALIGATAALASSFGCFHLRRTIVKGSSLPDPTIGAIEDALVMSTGLGLVSMS